ncbi:lysosomal proton-coupled steroid conjugate and bile acid symporter SLC46A3 isoform X7 [Mobula hypostoma]|uniref:lysosomal proton-coupled steroid conjugate and bile acid symporter SLC46A3 isoform X7 n=1 Tax=Mobula hypostoma TaxID=723540 RepID=UPI002FC346D2
MDLRTIVTVEPVVFLYLMSGLLNSFAVQQLVLVKVCEELHFEKEVCSSFSHNSQESLVIQSKASYVMLLYVAVLTFLSIPMSILLGAWSDQGGRKLGEQAILILFLTLPPQHFSPELYGVYNAMKMFLGGAVLVGLFPLLLRCIREITLAKLGALLRVVSFILLAFSTNTWMAFLSAVMNSFSGFPGPVLRSMASSVVEQNEQGAMYSCMASIDTICIIIGSSAFYALYPETLSTLPGFSFIVMAGFQVILLILVQWLSEIPTSHHPLIDAENRNTTEE